MVWIEPGGEARVHVLAEDHAPQQAPATDRLPDEPRGDDRHDQRRRRHPLAPARPPARPPAAPPRKRQDADERQEQRRHELGHEADREPRSNRQAVATRPLDPPREMEDAAAVGGHRRGLHVVAAEAVVEEHRPDGDQDGGRAKAARNAAQATPEQVDVEEHDGAEQGVDRAHAGLVPREHADPHQPRDGPELQGRFLEEGVVERDRAGRDPVAGVEHAIDGVGVDGLVVLQVGSAEAHPERDAADDDHGDRACDERPACRRCGWTRNASAEERMSECGQPTRRPVQSTAWCSAARSIARCA